MTNAFPLPFNSLRQIRGGKDRSYVIGAMFTAGYSKEAERLIGSCEKFGLPYDIHEVPTVHRSISLHGSEDLSFTKANFIHHLLDVHARPILYLDADCEFMSEPVLVDELVGSGCDFAIYNWMADEHTDTFVPVELGVGPDGPPLKNRFYRFNHSVDWYTTSQLICSGIVQLYGNSAAARSLLAEWHCTIATFDGSADDLCLDFTFNHLGRRSDALKVHWLPKAYARFCWWIYAKPVINHPARPRRKSESKFVDIVDPAGRQTFYPSLAEVRNDNRLFPRDCIIDTERGVIGKIVGDQLVTIKVTDETFWL